ncbi:endoribonuclease L-PSP [Paraphaeosphaeria sporulosa]
MSDIKKIFAKDAMPPAGPYVCPSSSQFNGAMPVPIARRQSLCLPLLPQYAPIPSDAPTSFANPGCPLLEVAGPNIYVSGCIPADATGALVTGSIATQTQACIDNIKAILAAAGSDISRVVKVNVFLTDMADFAEMNGVYAEAFAHKPARSCVAVKQLPKGVPVEIECVAFNGTRGSKL